MLVPMDGKSQACVFLDTPGHEVNLISDVHVQQSF